MMFLFRGREPDRAQGSMNEHRHKEVAEFLLVSTHIVCERRSVLQNLAWVRRFCAQKLKFTPTLQ